MNQNEFQQAMNRSEFCCPKCDYAWFSLDARHSKICPACTATSIQRITGEGLRKDSQMDRIDLVLRSLTYREREIIKLRYAIADDYEYKLVEVGKIFKLTPARICQIEAKAIRKLQHPKRMETLRECGLDGQYARLTIIGGMARLIRKILD